MSVGAMGGKGCKVLNHSIGLRGAQRPVRERRNLAGDRLELLSRPRCGRIGEERHFGTMLIRLDLNSVGLAVATRPRERLQPPASATSESCPPCLTQSEIRAATGGAVFLDLRIHPLGSAQADLQGGRSAGPHDGRARSIRIGGGAPSAAVNNSPPESRESRLRIRTVSPCIERTREDHSTIPDRLRSDYRVR